MRPRTTRARAYNDTEGRTTCAQPLIDPLKNKKTRIRARDFDFDQVKKEFSEWAATHKSDLDIDALVEDARDLAILNNFDFDDQVHVLAFLRRYAKNPRSKQFRQRGRAQQEAPRQLPPAEIDIAPDIDLEAADLWARAGEAFQRAKGDGPFRNWFCAGRLEGAAGGRWTIAYPDNFRRDYMRSNHAGALQEILERLTGKAVSVEIITRQKAREIA